MIQIAFDETGVTATGHAGYAEPGQDIVCAGISALMCTAAQRMEDMDCAGLLAEPPDIRIAHGDIRLRCRPTEAGRAAAEGMRKFLETGCRMMADAYPEYIVITDPEGT